MSRTFRVAESREISRGGGGNRVNAHPLQIVGLFCILSPLSLGKESIRDDEWYLWWELCYICFPFILHLIQREGWDERWSCKWRDAMRKRTTQYIDRSSQRSILPVIFHVYLPWCNPYKNLNHQIDLYNILVEPLMC